MSTIFFSHGTEDYPIAALFKNELEKMDTSVYLFEHDQKPGHDIASKLQKAIRDADITIVLLTKQSQYAPYVHQEIGYATSANKPIIPIVESGTDKRILGMLAGKEYIPFDPNNATKSLSDTQTFIHKHEMEKLFNNMALIAGAIILALIVAYAISES